MIRRIFFYWKTGIESAPQLVKICIESWQLRNPGWDIVILDDSNVHAWVDMTKVQERNPRLNVIAYSEVLRWKLLALHGGIWADATLFCCKPLDLWPLANLLKDEFFAFRSCEPHLYNSWFLVGQPSCSIVKAMDKEMDRFFIYYGGYRDYWELKGVWRFYHFLETHLGGANQEFWRSALVRRFLKATPYFYVMYLMGAAINRDEKARMFFNSITIEFGDSMHELQVLSAKQDRIDLADVKVILNGKAPVQKLTSKRFAEKWARDGVFDCLREHSASVD